MHVGQGEVNPSGPVHLFPLRFFTPSYQINTNDSPANINITNNQYAYVSILMISGYDASDIVHHYCCGCSVIGLCLRGGIVRFAV